MNQNLMLVMVVFIWGTTTFLQKLASDRMSPMLMQVIMATAFALFIPFSIRMEGGLGNLKWNTQSVILTFTAAFMSIGANLLLYSALSNNKHTGSSAMIISMYPAVTLLYSAVFLHEQFSNGKILGFLAMIAGACLLNFC